MRRCPACGFRTEENLCPLCGVKTKDTAPPVHAHTQKGETCVLPTHKPVLRQEQPSGQPPKYVRTGGKTTGVEFSVAKLILILVVMVAVMRACAFVMLS